jgi:PadR family transcriptional regulator, regulatory protein AphA
MTTTSYAILSLLAARPWTTYELTREMDRSLGRFWPRATSKLYEEPKKLVGHGFARAREEAVGRRPRTVYSITPKGRRALARWHREPGAGPALEFEALLKVVFAQDGTREDALASLAATRAWAAERNRGNVEAGRAFADGRGPFEARAAQTMLGGAFLTDFYAMVDRWAAWATTQVEAWPADPGDARADPDVMAEILRRATW